jgi:hypothetical protein
MNDVLMSVVSGHINIHVYSCVDAVSKSVPYEQLCVIIEISDLLVSVS